MPKMDSPSGRKSYLKLDSNKTKITTSTIQSSLATYKEDTNYIITQKKLTIMLQVPNMILEPR